MKAIEVDTRGIPAALACADRARALARDGDLALLFPRLLAEAGADRARIAVLAGGAGRLASDLRAAARGRVMEAADPLSIPIGDGEADLIACEHLLSWHPDPAAVVREFRRALSPGGRVLVAAEPDYHGAIEHPPAAAVLGLLAGVLRKRGAETEMGRRLPSLFASGEWSASVILHSQGPIPGPAGEALEGMIAEVRASLSGAIPEAVLGRWEKEARAASGRGSLFLHLPHVALVATRLHGGRA